MRVSACVERTASAKAASGCQIAPRTLDSASCKEAPKLPDIMPSMPAERSGQAHALLLLIVPLTASRSTRFQVFNRSFMQQKPTMDRY